MTSNLEMSPNRTQVSYVVETPNLESDEYEDTLYTAGIDGLKRSDPNPVLTSAQVGSVVWFPDNRHLAALIRLHGKSVLVRADSVTKTYDIIKEATGDITDYSMDAAGDTIAIAVKLPVRSTFAARTENENREGYRLDLDSVAPTYRATRKIYILRRVSNGQWRTEAPVSLISPLSGRHFTEFVDYHFLHVKLSPNGRHLLLDNLELFSELKLEGAWSASPVVKYLAGRLEAVEVNYLYDLQTHATRMPLQSPQVGEGFWAPDSNSYVKVAQAPVGSRWENADLAKRLPQTTASICFP